MRALASALPDWLQIVLASAGLGTLIGTAFALVLVARFPNLHHWRFIGAVSVFSAAIAVAVLLIGAL
ncbi:MAG: hypothetical protein MSC31_05885 [Solirubrobacteraceae bacterium MAG38_C4-C5]|nr:hypothetical protein [Candidatus Siliceabacter maunaloa]